MKKSAIVLGILLGVCEMSDPAFAVTQATATQSPATQATAALFAQLCSQCHLVKRALSKTKSKIRWQKTVGRCRKRLDDKASSSSDIYTIISEEDVNKITAYLYSERPYKSPGRTTETAQEKRRKLLDKFTPAKARTGAATDKRKKLLDKFTPSKASTGDGVSERRKKLKEKFTPSKTVADRQKEVRGKFIQQKANTGSAVDERRKKLKEKFSTSKTIADRQKEAKEKIKSAKPGVSAAEAKRNKFREKFPPQKARTRNPGSRADE